MNYKSITIIAITAFVISMSQYSSAEDDSIDINIEVTIPESQGIMQSSTYDIKNSNNIQLNINTDAPEEIVHSETQFCIFNNSNKGINLTVTGKTPSDTTSISRKKYFFAGDENGYAPSAQEFYVFDQSGEISSPIDIFYKDSSTPGTGEKLINGKKIKAITQFSKALCETDPNSTLIAQTRASTGKDAKSGFLSTVITLSMQPE